METTANLQVLLENASEPTDLFLSGRISAINSLLDKETQRLQEVLENKQQISDMVDFARKFSNEFALVEQEVKELSDCINDQNV